MFKFTAADHIKRKEEEKKQRLEAARQKNELLECGCCYDDELLPEDMMGCPDGHKFCKLCIRRSTEELIGQAKLQFPCLSADCKSEFHLRTLQEVLSSKMFSTLLRKIQEEEIKKADIPDLVCCPFCTFATIMPDENDKVFKCENPECMKESCRFVSNSYISIRLWFHQSTLIWGHFICMFLHGQCHCCGRVADCELYVLTECALQTVVGEPPDGDFGLGLCYMLALIGLKSTSY